MVYLGCISRYSPLRLAEQVEERLLLHQPPPLPPPRRMQIQTTTKKRRQAVCLCICPSSSGAAATNHIELLPQDPPFLQRGGGLCDNRVLQGHHRLAQPEGRKHKQHSHAFKGGDGLLFALPVMSACGRGGRCCRRTCACCHCCPSASTTTRLRRRQG